MVRLAHATSEGSDEHAHPQGLAGALTAHIHRRNVDEGACLKHVRIQRGGTGGPDPPPRKSQKCRFFSNTDRDLLKILRIPSQHSILGHNNHASKMPFKWPFAGGPMMAR